MLSVIVIAICMTCPFVVFHFATEGGSWTGFKDLVFNTMLSLLIGMFVSAILIVCILIPASNAFLSEAELEDTYSSNITSVDIKKKSLDIVIGDDKITTNKNSVTVRSSSDDPEIQEKINAGENVLQTYVQVSGLTLLEKREYVLYGSDGAATDLVRAFGRQAGDDDE